MLKIIVLDTVYISRHIHQLFDISIYML